MGLRGENAHGEVSKWCSSEGLLYTIRVTPSKKWRFVAICGAATAFSVQVKNGEKNADLGQKWREPILKGGVYEQESGGCRGFRWQRGED